MMTEADEADKEHHPEGEHRLDQPRTQLDQVLDQGCARGLDLGFMPEPAAEKPTHEALAAATAHLKADAARAAPEPSSSATPVEGDGSAVGVAEDDGSGAARAASALRCAVAAARPRAHP
jgi:hypothetical protein